MDLAEVSEMLTFYIRPQTFPFAVRLCESLDEVPDRTRIPHRDMGMPVIVCQSIGMVRRYGWSIALTKEDVPCPNGAVGLGFVEPKKGFMDGSFADSLDPGSGPSAARSAQHLPKLEFGKYAAVVIAPLHSARFEPHVIAMYGNSAQVMRLVQGAVYGRGGCLTSRASGGGDCADLIAQPMLTGDAHVVLPCNGDRVFGTAQDTEMAFTMPAALVEATLEGLKATHDRGTQRYPIPSFLRYQAPLPPSYYQTIEYLRKED